MPKRPTGETGEHKAIVSRLSKLGHMPAQIRRDHFREVNHTPPRIGLSLGGPKTNPAPLISVSCRSIRTVRVSRSMPQRRQLAPSQTAETGKEHERPAADSNNDSNGASQRPPRTHGSIPPRSGLVTKQEACYA
jgi:hypothetical protein